jgi:hypothetical protein
MFVYSCSFNFTDHGTLRSFRQAGPRVRRGWILAPMRNDSGDAAWIDSGDVRGTIDELGDAHGMNGFQRHTWID